MAEGLVTGPGVVKGRVELLLLILLLGILGWQAHALYDHLTASPARWAAAMAAGDTAFNAGNWAIARDDYADAVTEARKFGPYDARLALALDAHAPADVHATIPNFSFGDNWDGGSVNPMTSFDTIRDEGLSSWMDDERKRSTFRRCYAEVHRATNICRAVYGPRHPRTADALIQEAIFLPDKQALPMFREAMTDWHAAAAVPRGKQACYALSMAAWRSKSDVDTAFAMYQLALAGAEREYALGDRWTGFYLIGNMASSIAPDVKDKVAAEHYLRKGLDWTIHYLPATSPRALEARKDLAMFCEHNGRYAEARDLLVQCVTVCTSGTGAASYMASETLRDLADFDARRGNTSLAAEEYARAVAIANAPVTPPPSPVVTPP